MSETQSTKHNSVFNCLTTTLPFKNHLVDEELAEFSQAINSLVAKT